MHRTVLTALDLFLEKNYESGSKYFTFTLNALPRDLESGEKHINNFRDNFYKMADTILVCAKRFNINTIPKSDFAQFDDCTTRASRNMFIRWKLLFKALSDFYNVIRSTDIALSECLEPLTFKETSNKTDEILTTEANYCIGEAGAKLEQDFFDHTDRIYKESYVSGLSIIVSVDIQSNRCILDGLNKITHLYLKKYKFDINQCIRPEHNRST